MSKGVKSNKEILIEYVATLSDEQARKAWYILQDLEVPMCEWYEWDKVRLSTVQYNKLVAMWGEEKTKSCIDILNDWIIKKNITRKISCYENIITWVETEYIKRNKLRKPNRRVTTTDVDTITKAKLYIKSIPEELRAWDAEVRYLIERYGSKILVD